MTLTPLFWPRPSLFVVVLGLGCAAGAWLALRPPPSAVSVVRSVPAPAALALSSTTDWTTSPGTMALPLPPPLSVSEVRRFHYRVLRVALMRELNTHEPPLNATCRIVPAIRDARPAGFKLYAIRPDSLFARLGLQNGDLVRRVNGRELTTPDRALEIYAGLHELRRVRVDIERHGIPTQLVYEISD